MQDGVDIMPVFCERCIHRRVCKYIDKVKEWEDSRKYISTSTSYKTSPITIHCEEKENDNKRPH